MSAQEFKPGDRVEYVGHPKSGYVSDYLIGKYGTVARQENLSSDSVPVKWDHHPLAVDGVLALNIRLISAEPEDKDDLYVEPEPLKEGDWIWVAGQVTETHHHPDDVTVAMSSHNEQYQADVRRDRIQLMEGTPPWAKPDFLDGIRNRMYNGETTSEDVTWLVAAVGSLRARLAESGGAS